MKTNVLTRMAAVIAAFCLASSLSAAEQTLVGTCVHYGWDFVEPVPTQSLMVQGGFNAYRDGVTVQFWMPDPTGEPISTPEKDPFASVRQHGGDKLPYKGAFLKALSLAQKNNLGVIVCMNGTGWEHKGIFPVTPETRQSFGEYVKSVMKATRNSNVAYYQIWNEWDGGHEMHATDLGKANTPENYVTFLKYVSEIIRKENPNAKILANSFCMGDDMLFRAFKAGLFKYCDAYAIHPYPRPITQKPEDVYNRMANIERVSAQHNGGTPKPFIITETGWNAVPGGVSDDQCGDYIARLFLLMKTLKSFRGMTWYSFHESSYAYVPNASRWGVTMQDTTPKPSFYCLQSVAPLVKDGAFVRRVVYKNQASNDENFRAYMYKMPDGRYVLAMWTPMQNCRVQLILTKKGGWDQELEYVLCGSPSLKRQWGFRNQAHDRKSWGVPVNNDEFSVQLTGRPVLLYGVPEDVVIDRVFVHDRTVHDTNAPAFIPTRVNVISRAPRTIEMKTGADSSRIKGMWKGPQDISATMTYRYDDKNIYFSVDVTDDANRYIDASVPRNQWFHYDHLDFGFIVIRQGQPVPRHIQYSVYPTAEGPTKFIAFTASMSERQTKITDWSFEQVSPTLKRYTFTVPYAELGADVNCKLFETHKAALGFSLFVWDADDTLLKCGVHWADGIMEGPRAKPATMYGHLYFER